MNRKNIYFVFHSPLFVSHTFLNQSFRSTTNNLTMNDGIKTANSVEKKKSRKILYCATVRIIY